MALFSGLHEFMSKQLAISDGGVGDPLYKKRENNEKFIIISKNKKVYILF